MKWFVYLFSIYLLTLSGFTCKAESDCCKEVAEQCTDTGHSQDDHQSHSACVPFLACGACNSIIIPKVVLQLPVAFILEEKVNFHYWEPSWNNAPASIWQPPQIA